VGEPTVRIVRIDEHGVFLNDHHYPSIAEALDHHCYDVDDVDDIEFARSHPVLGLPSARELLDDWACNVGCDVDGCGPDTSDVPDSALDALDAAIAEFNKRLPQWYEQGDDISSHPEVVALARAWVDDDDE
jgi:hypothetical protein